MKHLSDYIKDAQTAVLEKYGVFFAFSDQQFAENKKEGIKYVHVAAGMIVQKDNVEAVLKALKKVTKDGIALDIKENGHEAIIKRELNNYECHYTNDIDIVVKVLKSYGITYDQVLNVFRATGGVQ